MKKKENKEIIFKSSFFLKLFGVPAIVCFIITLIAMIPDETEPDPLTWKELIIADITLLLVWFAVSFVIVLIVNEIKKIKPKTKVIKEVHYITKTDEKITVASKSEDIGKLANDNDNKINEDKKFLILENKKSDNKYLYACESKFNINEYIGIAKYLPKIYLGFVIRAVFINLIISAIVAISSESLIGTLIFFVVFQVFLMLYYKIRLNYFIEKEFKEAIAKKIIDTDMHIEFYEDYLTRQGETIFRKIEYSDIDKCIENDTNFYLQDSIKNIAVIIQKKQCDSELINFIRNTFNNLESHLGDSPKSKVINKYRNPNFIKNGMFVLFILTIACLWLSIFSFSLIERLRPHHYLNVFKNMWIFFCWLPIPILSIILGFKFDKAGFKCTKNIVAGFIMGFIFIIFGSLSTVPIISEDYSKIDVYRDVIDAELPKNGELIIENWDTCSGADKTECTILNVYYDEDVDDLVSSIENSENWFLCKDISSKLKIFIPLQLYVEDDSYFSIYNKTTNEYNKLPETSGDYEIYAMKYSKSRKNLEIYKFKYAYK